MNCACHDQPAYWQKNSRMRVGGFWRCAVTKRAKQRAIDSARRDVKTARQRDRYDSDPIYRIEKRLADDARRRRQRLRAKREGGGEVGKVQTEG